MDTTTGGWHDSNWTGGDVSRESASELRLIAHQRLERVVQRLWLQAMPPSADDSLDLSAIDRIIRCIAADSRIMGYDSTARPRGVDLEHFRKQVGLIVEVIARVIPDDCVPRVHEALEDALETIQRQTLNSENL